MSWFGRASGPRLTLGMIGTGLFTHPFTLSPRLVHTHKHVIGLSGYGKSSLLATMAVQLIRQGVGVAVVDPQADLANDILAALAETGYFERPGARERFLYVDFTQPDRHVPYNVLARAGSTVDAIAEDLLTVFKRLWPGLADGAAPRFENILLGAVTILAQHGLPLTYLELVLTDKAFRERLLAAQVDPFVVSFFHRRFDAWDQRERTSNIESTLNKVFGLLYSPTLRYSLGQPENRLDFRALLESGTSVVFNLGNLPEERQRFLGTLITVGFEQAALARTDIVAKQQRWPYHLILDEFSMFSPQTEKGMGRMLSLARKCGLFVTLAHQTWSQVSERLAGALQNTVEFAFRLGPEDAAWGAPRLGSYDASAVKRVGEDGREYPVSVQETFQGWREALERLTVGEALVSVEKRTTRIRTRQLVLSPAAIARAQALRAAYNDALLVHQQALKTVIDAPTPATTAALKRDVPVDDDAEEAS